MSTIGGIMAFPNLGGYHASKWALEGLTESLRQEVASFGIKVTLVEPGGLRERGDGRQRSPRLRRQRVPEIPPLWRVGPWLRARTMGGLRVRAVGPVLM